MSPLVAVLAWSSAHAVTVTSLTDTVPSVPGELRHALENQVGPGTIDFQGSGAIVLTAPLPVIDGALAGLVLDGGGDIVIDASQTSGHALVVDGSNGVAIHGLTVRDADGYGVEVSASTNVTIGGTAAQANAFVGSTEAGIHVAGTSTNVTIARNRVGLSWSNAAKGNCTAPVGPCAGIVVEAGAAAVVLDYNVVGGNLGHGVAVYASGTSLFGNRIGTDTTGQVDQGNQGDGLLVSGTSTDPASAVSVVGNVLVGNDGHGVHLAAWSDSATVSGNYVGLTSTYAPLGNDGDGVHLAGGADHVVGGGSSADGNRIGANGGHGIAAAATTLDAGLSRLDLRNNLVGVDDTTTSDLGNGGYGLYLSLPVDPAATIADQHLLGATGAGNTLSGNDMGGAYLAAANLLFEGNRVGTDHSGLYAVPNGTTAGPSPLTGLPSSAGVRVVVSYDSDTSPVVLADNRVSGNHGAGVWASRSSSSTGVAARPVDLVDNDIGVAAGPLRAALGNGHHGVLLKSLDQVLVARNEVAHNDGDGLRVGIGAPPRSSLGVEVDANEVHHNQGAGVSLTADSVSVGTAPNLDGYVHDNVIEANGGPGIHLTGGATQHELTHNTITGNDECAILDEGDSDTSLLVEAPAPVTVDLVAGTIEGRVDVLNGTPARLELYERATGLHFADLAGSAIDADGRWTYSGALPASIVTADDVSGLVVLESGTTSEMTRFPGDGCTPIDCTPAGEEGNGCTVYWFDPGVGCRSVDRPPRYRCDDGVVTTGMINHRIDPTETTLYQDECDGAGVCVAGTDLTTMYGVDNEGQACPWKTDCNEADLRPEGCTYRAVDDANRCGVDAHFCDGGCDGVGLCSSCSQSALATDLNYNAVPDAWELNDFDFDCDTLVDANTRIGEGAVGVIDDELPPVYVFVAYMDMALNVDEYGNPLHSGSVHSHHLDSAMLADIELQFEHRGVDLIVEQVAIPHYTMVSDVRQNWDPDCNDVYDYATLDDLKARYFPAHKRGSYHFVLIAHSDAPPREEVTALDGECVRKGQTFSGKAESRGGDDARVVTHGGKLSDPNVEANHRADTKLFAHELGHTFGLDHGGYGSADNQAPNFQSVMNYRYQDWLTLVAVDGYHFDYSPEQVSLLEYSLDESVGFASTLPVAEYMTITWECPPGSDTTGMGRPNEPLNWNCTGTNTEVGIGADISGRDGETNLESRDEWDELFFPMTCNLAGRRDWVNPGGESAGDVNRFRDGPTAWREATADVAPSCPGNHVPLDDTHPIDLVITGQPDWSAHDLVAHRTRLAGGAPTTTTIEDVDGDGIDDLRFRFRPTDLFLMQPGVQDMIFNGHLSDGTALYAEVMADAASQLDGDGDGIIDPCDQCPGTLPNTQVGDDGC